MKYSKILQELANKIKNLHSKGEDQKLTGMRDKIQIPIKK